MLLLQNLRDKFKMYFTYTLKNVHSKLRPEPSIHRSVDTSCADAGAGSGDWRPAAVGIVGWHAQAGCHCPRPGGPTPPVAVR